MDMNRFGRWRMGPFVLILLFLSGIGLATARDATLTNIIVTNTRDDLLVYLTVEGAFTQEMEEAVKSGVPASFTFLVNLHRSRGMWFDKEMADLTITHTIKYNSLKNVTALNCAVTDKESLVIIEDSQDNPVDNRLVDDENKGIPVKSKTIDQIAKDTGITHVDFLKMNIEGAEKLAIKGMEDTIKKTRQVCIACHDFLAAKYGDMEMKTKNDVIKFLKKNNFKVFTREGDPIEF